MDYYDQYGDLRSLLNDLEIKRDVRDKFYDFYEASNKSYYDAFFGWATVNAKLHEEIVPPMFYLYFFDQEKNDAFAVNYDGKNVIGVSNFLLENLIQRCLTKGPEMEKAASNMGLNIRNLISTPASDFIFLVARHFLYFHEFAHLIQYNDVVIKQVPKPNNQCTAEEKLLQDHVKERDADIFAANLTMSQIQGMFMTYPLEFQNAKTLEGLVTLSLVALYLVFDILSDGLKKPIYYEETDHPHHIIRINLLMRMMITKAKRTANVENLEELNVLPLSLTILSALNEDSLNRFLSSVVYDEPKIRSYEVKFREEIERYKWTAGAKMEIWHNEKFLAKN